MLYIFIGSMKKLLSVLYIADQRRQRNLGACITYMIAVIITFRLLSHLEIVGFYLIGLVSA